MTRLWMLTAVCLCLVISSMDPVGGAPPGPLENVSGAWEKEKKEKEGTEGKGKGEEEKKPSGKEDEAGDAGKTVAGSGLPLERLIQLNSRALFGAGEVKVADGRVDVLLNKVGHLYSAFGGQGLVDSTHEAMKGANRRFIQYGDQKDGEKLLPGLAAIGYRKGLWVSRFPLAGDAKVKFEMRVPNLLTRQSVLRLRLNWDGKSGYETRFFNTIARLSGGNARRARSTKIRAYRTHPRKWFPRKGESVPIEFGIEDGNCIVRFNGKVLVSYPRVKDTGGKVVFLFNKILFTVQNLRISGKIDLEWCKARLADLEKKGELVVKEPPKESEKPAEPVDGE